MAEALVDILGKGRFKGFSAGSRVTIAPLRAWLTAKSGTTRIPVAPSRQGNNGICKKCVLPPRKG